ncbi:ABC transporter permease [Streptomyces sp. NPDC006385]|uniref:ABC transporter permease n=1 Tax=Streptomyces sp. NPDC006385 TaxID=3156761 RepID=UPI0033AEE4B9
MTTALTVEAPVTAARSRGPRGLLWAMLRLHRSALWFWLMLVAVSAGALLWAYGPGGDSAWAEFRAEGCAEPSPGWACDYSSPAYSRYSTVISVGADLLNLVPLLTAAWAGAALIGRELESGTARLAWTQSVSPARWLAAKLAVPAALLVPGTLAVTLAHRLMSSSDDELLHTYPWYEWHIDSVFPLNGTIATAYPLLGLAVGALAGLLVRRALPALGTAVLGLAILMSSLKSLRPNLWPAETVTTKGDFPEGVGMVVDQGALTSTGARAPMPDCAGEPGCLAAHDLTGYYSDHHPSSHFWPLQLVETGVVLAVTALVVLIAFRLLKRLTGAAV